jgi:hypothetical protein
MRRECGSRLQWLTIYENGHGRGISALGLSRALKCRVSEKSGSNTARSPLSCYWYVDGITYPRHLHSYLGLKVTLEDLIMALNRSHLISVHIFNYGPHATRWTSAASGFVLLTVWPMHSLQRRHPPSPSRIRLLFTIQQ